jgi:hypothetical protein
MSELVNFLQLPPYPDDTLIGPLRDQRGREWVGNSSFRDQPGVSRESVGRFRECLPQPVQSFIETAAAPEMRLLGYDASPPDAAAFRRYHDPFSRIHAKFPPDYSADAGRVRDEIQRLEWLSSQAILSDDEARRWFIYPKAYMRLREAARSH